jgi:hypothetical protein
MSEEIIVDKTPEKKEEVNPRGMSTEELSNFTRGKVNEEKTEEKKEETSKEPEKETEKSEDPQDEIKRLKEQLAAKTKQVEDRGEFIKQLDGIHEKKMTSLKAELDRQQKIIDETSSAGEAAKAANKIEKTTEAIEQAKFERAVAVNKEDTITALPDFEEKMPLMKEILKEDGFDEKTIKEFEDQPFINDPVLLKQIYKRAEAIALTKSFDDEIKKLKANEDELKKKPDDILGRIEKAANRKPVTAASGGTSESEREVTEVDRKRIASMSDEELKELRKARN